MTNQDEQSLPPSHRDVQDESVSLPQAEGATGNEGANTRANTNVETSVGLSRTSNAVTDTCSPPVTIDSQPDGNGQSTCSPPTTDTTEERCKSDDLVLPDKPDPDQIKTNMVQVELPPLPLHEERQIRLEWSTPEVLLDERLPVAPNVSLIDKLPIASIGKIPVESIGKLPGVSAGKHAFASYDPIWVPGILSAATAPGAADLANIAGWGTPPPSGPSASSLLAWMEFSAVGHEAVYPLPNLQLGPLPQLGGAGGGGAGGGGGGGGGAGGGAGGGGPGGAHGMPNINDVPDLESGDEEDDEALQESELAEGPSAAPQ
ncbi:hypothetical protein GGF31_007336 [Allomyces arbusculus]|nr:hypothetical protein GGF31_007336 [Allomyces arbusculus]